MKMTEEKLRCLMTHLESESVERTRAFDKIDKMGQAICAFANDLPDRGEPGYLLLGVENDGKVSGKRIDDECLTSLGGLKSEGNLLPPPAMALDVFHLPEGDVAVITVFPSAYPPIRYQGQVWVRVGARKALATEEDIHLLEEKCLQHGRRFEERPCPAARMEDMDLELFRNLYLPKAIQSEVIEEDSRPIREQMSSLRFYDWEANAPTNLGMLLFGKHPEMFIPSAYLQYVKFSTGDNGGDILAEHAYKGPLLKIIPELDGFVKVGIAQPRPVRVSILQEETVRNYPDWSIRELLLNAIIHRDYQIGNAPVKFYDYNGMRLEISNPGGLYGQAKPENFPYVNDYRNPLLAEALKVMGYVNKFNRGISKVKTEMQSNGNPLPVFDVNKQTEFRVTVLPNTTVPYRAENDEINGTINGQDGTANGMINGTINHQTEKNDEINGDANNPDGTANGTANHQTAKNDEINGTINHQTEKNDEIKSILMTEKREKNRESALIAYIEQHPCAQRKELAEHIMVSLPTLDRLLKKMTADSQNSKIEHRGSNKTGGWFIKS